MTENGIISPQTFSARGLNYNLITGARTFQVRINGKDVSNYLTMGTSVGWYDVSKNSGRDVTNANGTMILNIVSTKYRVDLATRYLTTDEFIDFFSPIIGSPTMTVEFYNPFTGYLKTIKAYRGDRTGTPYMPNGDGTLYQGTTIALIEL